MVKSSNSVSCKSNKIDISYDCLSFNPSQKRPLKIYSRIKQNKKKKKSWESSSTLFSPNPKQDSKTFSATEKEKGDDKSREKIYDILETETEKTKGKTFSKIKKWNHEGADRWRRWPGFLMREKWLAWLAWQACSVAENTPNSRTENPHFA